MKSRESFFKGISSSLQKSKRFDLEFLYLLNLRLRLILATRGNFYRKNVLPK